MRRLIFLVFSLACAGTLLWLSVPKALSEMTQLVGHQALTVILAGEKVTPKGYDRLITSRLQGLEWDEHPRAFAELGLAFYARAREEEVGSAERDDYLRRSRRLLREAVALLPVHPVAWLLLARIDTELQNFEEAAEALANSLKTSPFMPKDVTIRTVLGFLYWDALDEETRAHLALSIAALLQEQPMTVVELAHREGRVVEVAQLLKASIDDSADLLRLYEAVLIARLRQQSNGGGAELTQ